MKTTWYNGRFAVERECTDYGPQRHAECGQRGYHVVDSHDELDVAIADAKECDKLGTGAIYRVVEQATQEVRWRS